jgi:hypothetical protein
VAGEAGVPFFSVSASEFVELYVGMVGRCRLTVSELVLKPAMVPPLETTAQFWWGWQMEIWICLS